MSFDLIIYTYHDVYHFFSFLLFTVSPIIMIYRYVYKIVLLYREKNISSQNGWYKLFRQQLQIITIFIHHDHGLKQIQNFSFFFFVFLFSTFHIIYLCIETIQELFFYFWLSLFYISLYFWIMFWNKFKSFRFYFCLSIIYISLTINTYIFQKSLMEYMYMYIIAINDIILLVYLNRYFASYNVVT